MVGLGTVLTGGLDDMQSGVMMPAMAGLTTESPRPDPSMEGRGPVARQLVCCAAFAKELETQAHLIHLNYEGSNFLSVHPYLKGQYEAHLEQFDVLAEFVRTLDFLMPMCACGLKEMVEGFQNVADYDGRQMLMTYCGNLERITGCAKELEAMAGEARLIDVQNYAAELVAASMKAAWFLKATLRGC